MAVQFDSDIKRGVTEWMAYPDELDVSPELNGRHELPDIEWLIASMLLPHGQIQPVSIRKTAGRPMLTAGYSRYRAVSEINKRKLTPDPIRLRCSYTSLTDQQAFIATIHENHVRNATTPMDDAYNIQKLINVFRMDEDGAAEVYRASKSWIRERLALLELAPEVQEGVQKGRVKPSAAKAIGKLSRDLQKQAVARPGKVTAADIKAVTPKAAPKPSKPSLRDAVRIMLAECDQQPDAMVVEIHRDIIRAVREALES